MINVAVIGTGSISTKHIAGFKQFADRCKVVALMDIYPEKSKKLNEQYNLNADIYSDHQELLKREDIDVVSICTPPYTHASLTVDSLNAGKHVLVEKPMASSLKECDEMNAAAKTNHKILSVIAQNRFLSPMFKLKNVLDSGELGKIAHAQIDSFWWRGHSYYDLWWRGTWEKEGGGCTLNHAVHHIDLLQWMMGAPTDVTAITTNVMHDNAEVEDLSVAIFRFSKGRLGQVTSSVVHHGEEQQLVFQGEKARVSVPWKVKASIAKENGFPHDESDISLEKKIEDIYDRYPKLQHEEHTGQIDNFLTAVEKGEPVLIDGEQGRRTLELIMAIYKSANTGQTVKLPLAKDDPFYTSEGVKANVRHFFEKKNNIENFSDNTITTGTLNRH
ncbi:Gfo/Idh/MocA family protein [Chengkuizengella axinellae]|uniref:Gfo/Idh/MocA family oxidoreductase n=1 Tax=Chengkuizengella axinellae TaxID=3064388 RepID=A0ABT9IXG0_9BACL|nr:Gfo/Idh/MocA family oxidoreductase [Chengkuizengella sp. 2205SS18-9]MDP5274058.1 Gfo/Idh/MocA family oxidoreductase [Chengkuizengella sp. 2205SS18-9]